VSPVHQLACGGVGAVSKQEGEGERERERRGGGRGRGRGEGEGEGERGRGRGEEEGEGESERVTYISVHVLIHTCTYANNRFVYVCFVTSFMLLFCLSQ